MPDDHHMADADAERGGSGRGDSRADQVVATLRLSDVTKSFPGAVALRGVSLEVRPGEVMALLGENGAGKSTLIKIASGALAPDHGTVWIAGERLRRATPRAARAMGVRVLHQERQIAADLSVAENVLLDRLPTGPLGLVRHRRVEAAAGAQMRRLGIAIDPGRPADGLSVAEQQLVELARAVAEDARLVIMDEPTASLHQEEILALFDIVRGLHDQGVAVLYISHHLEEVFEIANRVTVLRDAVVAGERAVPDTTPDELIELIFGQAVKVDRQHVRRHVSAAIPDAASTDPADPADPAAVAAPTAPAPAPAPAPNLAPPRVEMTDVIYRTTVRGVTLRVEPGEILAITGNQGSGASEVAGLLAGVISPTGGAIRHHHATQRLRSRRAHSRRGVAFLPADRKRAGLLLDRSITDNLMLSQLAQRGSPLFNGRRAHNQANRMAGEVGIKAPDLRAPIRTLSGGNQQKAILGRWLGISRELLIFDEPTAGVDISSKVDLYHRLVDLASQGTSVVFVSSDYEEISALADRVLVMRDGRIIDEIAGDDASAARLLRSEMGAA